MVDPSWWKSAERKIFNLKEAKEFFEKLISLHPSPESLLEYLNERRFILLLELLEQSECIRNFLFRHPEEFQKTIPGLWYITKEKEDYLKELRNIVSDSDLDEKFSEKLAYYRHKELMRILSKDILGTSRTEDILREYSYLADAIVEVAYKRAFEEIKEKFRKPVEENGKEASAVVLGLGKLGSEELNYYSDIDLIFIHSSDRGSAGKLSLNEFFSELFKKLVKLVSSQTKEGQPYKVDLDLRPFGKTGPISMSIRSAELYYESYGRIWERFALLRTRPVAGDMELGDRFMREVVKPFVFSSADYKLIEEIRNMKKRIEAQAKKKLSKGYNVKTGEGGIREIEFTVQSLVILLGNRSPFLREANTFRAIWKLNQKGIFSDEETAFLEDAYAFLRNLEHKIQIRNCIQKQSFMPEEVPYYAKVLNFESPQEFEEKLESVKRGVKEIFDSLIPERRKEDLSPVQIALITEDADLGTHLLKQMGFSNPKYSFNLLMCYVYGKEGLKLSDKEKAKFIDLAPRIIELASSSSDPDETLKNFEKFFSNPTGRKVILSDPKEDFLEGLFRVFSLSSTLSNLISKNPDLVEDVLTLYREYPNLERLKEEFQKYRETLPLSEENLFRRFKKVWEIRIGLVYLMGEKTYENLKKLFESLSMLADFLLSELWKSVGLSDYPAVIYSLGKLGSRELSFGSDLDIVFAVGDQKLKEDVFKRVQKLVRFITAHTSEGYLYDVDFRLRPMGSRGELVPTLDFYSSYFKREARTWERIAWTRARYISGDEETKNKMEEIIEDFLFSGEWGQKERKEVYEMRLRLQEVAKRGRGVIDLKFAPGGIVDGEFLVQYLLIKEKIRETSMIEGFRKLSEKYPYLTEAYDASMFLRLVETQLRLLKERGSSVITDKDMKKIATSLNMEEEELKDEINKQMKTLRNIFLEVME